MASILKQTSSVELSSGKNISLHGLYLEHWQDAMVKFSNLVEILAIAYKDEKITDDVVKNNVGYVLVELYTAPEEGNKQIVKDFFNFFTEDSILWEKISAEDIVGLWLEVYALNARPFALKRNQMQSAGQLEILEKVTLKMLSSALPSTEQELTQENQEQLQLPTP